jgi:hypothetical protein
MMLNDDDDLVLIEFDSFRHKVKMDLNPSCHVPSRGRLTNHVPIGMAIRVGITTFLVFLKSCFSMTFLLKRLTPSVVWR